MLFQAVESKWVLFILFFDFVYNNITATAWCLLCVHSIFIYLVGESRELWKALLFIIGLCILGGADSE